MTHCRSRPETPTPGRCSSPPWLDIREVDARGDTVRLTLAGELDLATGEAIRMRLREGDGPRRPITLDLSELSFIDCAGLQALVRAAETAHCHGVPLEFERRPSEPVRRLIELLRTAGLEPRMPAAMLELDGC